MPSPLWLLGCNFVTHVPFCILDPAEQLSGMHLFVLGSKRWSFVHECVGGKHGIASAIGGHDDVHDELYSLVVQSVGCGLGHDGSLGFIVQKPSLTQELPLVNINITGHVFFCWRNISVVDDKH